MSTDNLDQLERPPGESGRRMARATILLLLAAAVVSGAFWLWKRAAVAREHALPPLYEPAEVTVQGVDWGVVHSQLVPAWLIDAGSGQATGEPLTQLRAAVADVPEMRDALERMAGAVNAASPAEVVQQRRAAVDDWNGWLSDNGVRFQLRLPTNPRWQTTYLLSYYRVAEIGVSADQHAFSVVIDTRVDALNLREGYAGHTAVDNRDIALLVDRVADSASQSIWPLLDVSASGDIRGISPELAELARSEIGVALGDDTLRALRTAAPARLTLVETLETINDRLSCGGGLVFQEYPILGFPRSTLDEFDANTDPASTVCPDITNAEVASLREASHVLRTTSGLFDALQRLTAFASIEVAVHESAHALRNVRGSDARCEGCPFDPQGSAAHEYDAFLASLAHPGIGYTSLAMACQLLASDARSPHTVAIEHMLERIDYADCAGQPPQALASRARDVRMQDFGTADTFTLSGVPDMLRPMTIR